MNLNQKKDAAKQKLAELYQEQEDIVVSLLSVADITDRARLETRLERVRSDIAALLSAVI